jgi:hypothetical protein
MAAKGNEKSCCGGQPVNIAESLPPCDYQGTQIPDIKPCCPASTPVARDSKPAAWHGSSRAHWVKGAIETASGNVPQIDTSLKFRDILGGWKARWGINRMNYLVAPGLYGVGDPNNASPVLVTANYKMTFDRLRKELAGLNAWIMVLDTHGINVWCAAGKGTFGTTELVKRIAMVGLGQLVSHRTLILPQLGAPGVAAHEVRKQSGFKVVYGPVQACEIKTFLKANMKATAEMKAVRFGFLDRLILTPIEVVIILKPLAIITAALLVARISGLTAITFSVLYPFFGAVLIGAVIAPALLPRIPGRPFSWKGGLMGLTWTTLVLALHGNLLQPYGILNAMALLFLLPAISAFLTLNFTGASTYTSLSGVKREMRFALPAIIASAAGGIGLWVVGFIT